MLSMEISGSANTNKAKMMISAVRAMPMFYYYRLKILHDLINCINFHLEVSACILHYAMLSPVVVAKFLKN